MKRYISHDQFRLFSLISNASLIDKLNLHYSLITQCFHCHRIIFHVNSLYYRNVISILQISKFFRISQCCGPYINRQYWEKRCFAAVDNTWPRTQYRMGRTMLQFSWKGKKRNVTLSVEKIDRPSISRVRVIRQSKHPFWMKRTDISIWKLAREKRIRQKHISTD